MPCRLLLLREHVDVAGAVKGVYRLYFIHLVGLLMVAAIGDY